MRAVTRLAQASKPPLTTGMLQNLADVKSWDSWFAGRHAQYDDWLPYSTAAILRHMARAMEKLTHGMRGIAPNTAGRSQGCAVIHIGCGTSVLSPAIASLRTTSQVINIDASAEAVKGAQSLFQSAQVASKASGGAYHAPSSFYVGSMRDVHQHEGQFRGEPLVIVDKCGIDAVVLGKPPEGGVPAAVAMLRAGPVRALMSHHRACAVPVKQPSNLGKLPASSQFLHYSDEHPDLREPLLRKAGFRRVRWTSLGIPQAAAAPCDTLESSEEPIYSGFDSLESADSVADEVIRDFLTLYPAGHAQDPAEGTGSMRSPCRGKAPSRLGGMQKLLRLIGAGAAGHSPSSLALRREAFAYVAEV